MRTISDVRLAKIRTEVDVGTSIPHVEVVSIVHELQALREKQYMNKRVVIDTLVDLMWDFDISTNSDGDFV